VADGGSLTERTARSHSMRNDAMVQEAEDPNPVWSTMVPSWLLIASKVATGSRPRVLEDGPDTMNSGDEDAKKDDHGDDITDGYAPGCASLDQARISEAQAQMLRAAAQSSQMMIPVLLSS
jgi:hypothetical protein